MRNSAVAPAHFDHVAGVQHAESFGPRNLVLTEQELDALGVLRNDIELARHHRAQVDARVVGDHAVFGPMQSQPLEVLGRLQQRLGRNAAHVDTGAAQRAVGFDAGDREAKLRRAYTGDVAAGPTAEDDDIGGQGSGGSHPEK